MAWPLRVLLVGLWVALIASSADAQTSKTGQTGQNGQASLDIYATRQYPDLAASAYTYYGNQQQASGVANAFAQATIENVTLRVAVFAFNAAAPFDNVDSFSMFKPSPASAAAVQKAPPASLTRIHPSDVEGEPHCRSRLPASI